MEGELSSGGRLQDSLKPSHLFYKGFNSPEEGKLHFDIVHKEKIISFYGLSERTPKQTEQLRTEVTDAIISNAKKALKSAFFKIFMYLCILSVCTSTCSFNDYINMFQTFTVPHYLIQCLNVYTTKLQKLVVLSFFVGK